MPHAIMVVAAYPASPELEDDLNIWYSDVHMSDVLAVPGVVGFTRYRRAAEPELSAGPLGAPYLSIVTIDAEDVDATLQELRSRNGTDAMRGTPALGRGPGMGPFSVVYELIE